jgi:hypothetical protein
MLPQKTAVEMFEEMALKGFFVPAIQDEAFALPTMLKAVPAITTYSTPAAPLGMGTNDAGLEERTRRNRG